MSTVSQKVTEQQVVVSKFGMFALQETDLQKVLEEAVQRVAQVLEIEYCKVLELLPGQDKLLLKAGVGWQPGYVGQAMVDTDQNSQVGFTLLSDDPVIVEDLASESRFSGPPLLTKHNVVSGISAVIKSTQAPYGVMGAHTSEKRQFTKADAYFLQSIANILGEAIERNRAYTALEKHVEERTANLQHKNALLHLLEVVASAANEAQQVEDALQVAIDAVCRFTGWPLGHVYQLNKTAQQLDPLNIWNAGIRKKFENFVRATSDTSMTVGEGLPGRVVSTGQAAWIVDVTEDENFPRARLVQNIGVKGAFGFPVWSNDRIQFVLEFFSEKAEVPDKELLDAMDSVGMQLGRVVERVEARRALEASEKRYRSITASASDAIIVADVNGLISEWNSGAKQIFGYTREEMIGSSIERLMPERQIEPHRAGMNRYKRTRKAHIIGETVELKGLRKDGSEFPLELSLSAWETDEKLFFSSIIRDISDRKKAVQALRESEEKFRMFAEKSLVGIYLFQDGVFKYVNPGLAEMLGYEDPEEVVGKLGPQSIIHPDDLPRVQESIRQRLEGQVETARNTVRLRTQRGVEKNAVIYGGRIEYQGKPAIMGSILDITRERRLEQEVLKIQEAERRRIGQDLHDGIAAQLSGLTMMIQSMARDMKEEREVKAEELEEVGTLLKESANDARRLSRGLNPVKLEKDGLASALNYLAENTKQRARIACIYEQEGEVSHLPGEVATHLYWIAQEAVSNALKHAEAEHIWIRLAINESDLQLTIEDDGQGMISTDSEGNGLGLHTMKYRADIIGGSFAIDQRAKGGTVVRCVLPKEYYVSTV